VLRTLVGVAAVAMIAFVGYFFWGEWQRAQSEAKAAAELLGARKTECAMLAVDYERALRGENLGRRFSQAEAKSELATCEAAGLVDEGMQDFVRGLGQ